jgi:hypothetical protein
MGRVCQSISFVDVVMKTFSAKVTIISMLSANLAAGLQLTFGRRRYLMG